VDVLKKFDSIDTLRIDTKSDGNATHILTEMMKDANFGWFSSVKTLKCYDGLGITDKAVLQTFFTKFAVADTFKGIITDYFDPLELFPSVGKHVRNLYWSMPDNAALREKTLKFLEYNKGDFLRLYGGFCDKADVPTIHAESLRHVVFRDMPSVGLAEVFRNLPELQTFHIENVEAFDKEAFTNVFSKLATYTGLEKLVLDLLTFDLEEQKDVLMNVLRIHVKSLRHLSFARNKIRNEFMQYICE